MAKQTQRLSPRKVATVRRPGYYADGDNLWLQVSPTGTRSWILRFTLNGKAREMGLGSLNDFSLAEARDRANGCRKQLYAGIDPIEARRTQRANERATAANALTFDQCAERYIKAHSVGWRNEKHAAQWTSTLATYASPKFGKLPVGAIQTADVMRALEPIWQEKTETASRVRGRIESVLDWATVRGLRTGDNPARWRGHLESLLPARSKVQRVTHHAALPYPAVPGFVAALRASEASDSVKLGFEFLILSAARTGEILGARWSEIDTKAKVWTIPGERMKAKREHRVPLSDRCLAILKAARELGGDPYVFPAANPRRPLSSMAFLKRLRDTPTGKTRDDDEPESFADLTTAHGMRSAFRDWAAERTPFSREVCETSLAHANADKVEAAYLRSDLFEQRRALMNTWAMFCQAEEAPGKVTPFRKSKAA